MIKFLALREKLKNSPFITAFALTDGDSWVVSRAKDYVFNAYGITDDGFGVVTLNSPSVKDVTMACMTPSMFGDVKAVVCTDFVLPKTPEDKAKFASLVAHGDGTYCVIIEGTKTAVEGYEGLETVDCSRLDNSSVANWVVAYAKGSGVAVDRDVALKVADYCLCDMARVSNETQKLIDFGTFTADSVEAMVHKDVEYLVFDLGQTIAAKNTAKTLEMYDSLIRQGNDARSLFGVLYSFYRRVYYVKTAAYEPQTIADKLGVKVGAIGFAKQVADRYKPIQLKRALEFFDEADQKLKAFLSENDVMFVLIMQLLSL